MKSSVPFFLVSICTFFAACNDSENSAYNSGVKKIPVSEIIISPQNEYTITYTNTYSYDDLNRFSKIFYGAGEGASTTFFYEDNDLVKIIYEEDVRDLKHILNFTKENNKIIITNNFNVDNKKDSIYLNNDGFPTKYVTPSYYELYSYDSGNRLSKNERYNDNDLISTITYTYDHKQGILSHVNMPKWYFIIFIHQINSVNFSLNLNYINNLISLKNICPSCLVFPIDNSYTYDNDGYPKSCTNTNIEGSNTTIQYKNISQ